MLSSDKAQDKPYAIRVYINDSRQKRSILQRLGKGARLARQSRSAFILTAALEKADNLILVKNGDAQ